MKACTFLMNTAILMHFEFLFGLSKEKSQSSSYYNQHLLQADPSPKTLERWLTSPRMKDSLFKNFPLQIGISVFFCSCSTWKCVCYFKIRLLCTSRSWEFKGKNANLKTVTGNIMKVTVSWALTLVFFAHSSLSPTHFSPHLKGLVPLPAGRDWLPNCTRLVHCANRITANNTRKNPTYSYGNSINPFCLPHPITLCLSMKAICLLWQHRNIHKMFSKYWVFSPPILSSLALKEHIKYKKDYDILSHMIYHRALILLSGEWHQTQLPKKGRKYRRSHKKMYFLSC